MNWIKPEVEMPSTRRRVVVAVKRRFSRVIWKTIAEYIGWHEVMAEDFLDPDCDPDFCDIDDDGIEWAPEGWYESTLESDYSLMIDGDIAYWMPMPDLPKEAV